MTGFTPTWPRLVNANAELFGQIFNPNYELVTRVGDTSGTLNYTQLSNNYFPKYFVVWTDHVISVLLPVYIASPTSPSKYVKVPSKGTIQEIKS